MTCSQCGYKSDIHFQVCPQCSFDVLDGIYRDPNKASEGSSEKIPSATGELSSRDIPPPSNTQDFKDAPYLYKTAHFTGQLTAAMFGTSKGIPLETQFQRFIESFLKEGWEFYRTDTIHAYVKAGCFMSLFGRKDEVVYHDIVVFRKENK